MEFKFPALSYRAQQAWFSISPEDRDNVVKLGRRAGDAIVAVFAWSIGLPYKKPSGPSAEKMARGLIWKHYSSCSKFLENQSRSWKANWAKQEGKDGRTYPGDEEYARLHYPQYLTNGKLQGVEDSDNLEVNQQVNLKGIHLGFPSVSLSDSVSPSASKPISDSESVCQFDPHSVDDLEVRYGDKGIAEVLVEKLGKGFWSTAVKQLGEESVKEAFLTFCAEYRAGETVQKPAAAFTARLKKLGATAKGNAEVSHE